MKQRVLHMRAVLYMDMKPNETEEEAEDRLLELLEDAGINCYEWEEEEIETV